MPGKQLELLTIERQQKVKEALYVYLLNKKEENALSMAMTDDNARVIDQANGSYAPIYPNKLKDLAIGLLCGLAIPSVILLLMLLLDTSVKTRTEIEDVVQIPFLAEIPLAKDSQIGKNDILIRADGKDPISESFRILRTNLGFMNAGGKPMKVITFTSFSSGAGKTFTSMNLAASLIQLKKKVILLDLDLRKGTLSSQLQLKGVKGIAHYLSDLSINIDEIIVQNLPVQGLDMLPIGIIAPNPVELLLSSRFDELINCLKEKYDYVIVDNVPMKIVADSSIVNRVTDVTIFVVRSGKLDRRQLPELEKIYQEKKLNNLAIVLNGIPKRAYSYSYGYGYGYGYSYGYGYGYGSGYGNESKKKFWKFWKS